ncbi:substrate-binding periplasmic protein [Parvularcula marina]|uniref:substrate-binding periplasmic protein n=1 Tax=Parvularcula marina TaxID=2292771 RepID=UPI00351473E5
MKRILTGAAALLSLTIGAHAMAQEPEELRVCVAELQPWIYVDAEHDGIRGFEVDALKGLAEELNVTTSFVVRDFEDLKPSLMKGECDIIASGFSITLERVQDVSFSVPYNQTEYHLLVPTGSAEKYDSLDAFDAPEMRIGHLAGGVSGQVAEEFFPNAQLVPLPARIDSLDAFRNGEIDAYVSSDPFDEIINQVAPGEFTTFDDELLRVSIEAFAVRKNNTELLDKLNPFIIRGVNDNYFRTLHRKWFTKEEMLTGY